MVRAVVNSEHAMSQRIVAWMALCLLLGAVIPRPAHASYLEVCKLSGTATSAPVADGSGFRFRMHVESSADFVCHGSHSQSPATCQTYTGKEIEVGMTSHDAKDVKIGSPVELVQTVVDLYAGTHPQRERNWRLVSDCK